MLLPELDNGVRTGLMDICCNLLAWLSCPEESRISSFFNSSIELIRDGRACHILCVNIMSFAGAGCMANPEQTAGAAKPGQFLAGLSIAW